MSTTFSPGSYSHPNGMDICSPGITLDCNGAFFTGKGNPSPWPNSGIRISGMPQVTIKECGFGRYSSGVDVFSSDFITLYNNTATSPDIVNGFRTGTGLFIMESNHSTIKGNTVYSSDGGIGLQSSYDAVITFNSIRDVYTGISGAISSTIADNVVVDGFDELSNPSHGITAGNFNVITRNTVTNTSIGIGVWGDNNTLLANSANENKISGFDLTFVRANALVNNTANENGEYGIAINYYYGEDETENNILVGNTANGNNKSGILVRGPGARFTTLIANKADGNGYFGFELPSSNSVTVINNSAGMNGLDGFSFASNSRNVTSKSNSASSNRGNGFSAGAGSSTLSFLDNVASANRFHGFSVSGNNILMDNNSAQSNGKYGILFAAGRSALGNNTALMNGESGIIVAGSHNFIAGNTIASHPFFGIDVFPAAANATLINNKVLNNSVGMRLTATSQLRGNFLCMNTQLDAQGTGGIVDINNSCDTASFWPSGHCRFICGLQGTVGIPNPDGAGLVGLQNVSVQAVRAGTVISSNHTNASGFFDLHINDISFYTSSTPSALVVTLADNGTASSPFITVQQADPPPAVIVSAQTADFVITSTSDLERLVEFSDNPDIAATTIGVAQRDRLDDFGTIYYHLWQALNFSVSELGIPLDHALPVDVSGWGTGTYYIPSVSSIAIGAGNSQIASLDRPSNREWHEFSHHIMTDSLIGGENLLPLTAFPSLNHCMFNNPDSNDSWIEGFASAIPLYIASVNNYSNASRYYWAGGTFNPSRPYDDLELNYRVKQDEEFAIASLLWDVIDGVDNVRDNDSIQIPIKVAWQILNNPTDRDNMYGVYSGLKNAAIPAFLQDADGDGIANLDELFVERDIYNDTNGDGSFGQGEPLGLTTWAAPSPPQSGCWRAAGHIAYHRAGKPVRAGSSLLLTVIDETGQPIRNATLEIVEKNSPPFQGYDHRYSIALSSSSTTIGFSMLPTPSVATIYALSDEAISDPVAISSAFYWASLGGPFLLNHTFILRGPNVTFSGTARPGSQVAFKVSAPRFPNESYVFMLSLGTSPGIRLSDNRTIPLNYDGILGASLFFPSLIGLGNSQSLLDGNGNATVTWDIPSLPFLSGLTFYGGFVVVDSALPMPQAIKAISSAVPVLIQS